MKSIINYCEKPPLYEKGNAFMWTNPHIQPYLLDFHLNPSANVASRDQNSIDKTIAWINTIMQDKTGLTILDLGCGPGLYAERFSQLGHHVTGVDINHFSLSYAIKHTKDVTYLNTDYLMLSIDETFDLIYMIYCDFGVLSLDEQNILLKKVKSLLKPNGIFIMDGYNESYYKQIKTHRSWNYEISGFWSHLPHLVLHETFLYETEKAFLEQYMIIENNEKLSVYRFYNHVYTLALLKKRFECHLFDSITVHKHVIDDSTVDFYIFSKTKKE